MSNMSYCRFENTLLDVQDCLKALDNREISSDREKQKAKKLLKVMAEFLVSEGFITVDDDRDAEVDENGIDEFIAECK